LNRSRLALGLGGVCRIHGAKTLLGSKGP